MKYFLSSFIFMFLLSVCVTIPALSLIIIDRNLGLIEVNPNLLNGEESGIFKQIKDTFFSFQRSKDLGNGFIAYSATDTSQGIVSKVSEIEPNVRFLYWLCTSICTGREQRNPLMFEDVSYSIYGEMDEDLNETGVRYADVFYLKTGEIKRDTPIIEVPKILQNLKDTQIYGLDTLPNGVVRIDSNWIESSNYPTKIVRISDNCIRLGILITTINLFFGSLLIFSIVIKRILT